MSERERPSIRVRVWLLGPFQVQRRHGGAPWKTVEKSAWEGSYARLLFKRLLCASGRRSTRSELIDDLWPERSLALAEKYLNNASSKLYQLLREDDLLTTFGPHGSAGYQVADQEEVWTDIDSCETLLAEAERLGRTSPQALALLEEASTYLERGRMLEGESAQWTLTIQAEKEMVMRYCLLWQAEAYEAQGMLWHARRQYRRLLARNPLEEDGLCRLLAMLHRQGMIHDARVLYEEAQRRFEEYGVSLSQTTRKLAEHIRSRSLSPDVYLTPLSILEKSVEDSHQNGKIQKRPGSPILALPTSSLQQVNLVEKEMLDCTTRFGLTLAHMMVLISQWYGMAPFSHHLQNQLDQSIKELDMLKSQYPFEVFTLSRRHFLISLAALPSAVLTANRQAHKVVLKLEELLPQCAASITACWHLSGGSDLHFLATIIDSYLPTLVTIVESVPSYREIAADLVAQCYFLKTILSWHREGLEIAETSCLQALVYSELAENTNLKVTALNQHALICYYAKQFKKALSKSEAAERLLHQHSHEPVFPIVRGRVYMYLAAIQAQQSSGKPEWTLEQAHLVFDAQAVDEPIPLYADCGKAPLTLWDGLTHYHLSSREPAHADRALSSLRTFGQLQPTLTIPERFRLECVNNRILAAIQCNEMDEVVACTEAGKQGALALESVQRQTEVSHAHQAMLKRWPGEERVQRVL